MDNLLTELSKPFPPQAISWKPGATKDNKCLALVYGDLRAYQERLDEVCGLDWSIEYQPWGETKIIARLTIHGVTRSSTGEADTQDEKNNMSGSVSEAMSFKRAAAMFGLGRYLYDLPSVWVEFDAQRKRITEAGQRELDTRYKDWYKRQQTVKVESNGHNGHNHTVTIVDAPVAPENPFEEDGFAALTTGSPPHQRLWAKGMSCFGEDWNMARPWILKGWTKKITPDNVRTSAKDLNDDEKDAFADYMDENCKELRRIWPNQKKIEVTKLVAA